jgi:hypothetical protein
MYRCTLEVRGHWHGELIGVVPSYPVMPISHRAALFRAHPISATAFSVDHR